MSLLSFQMIFFFLKKRVAGIKNRIKVGVEFERNLNYY